MRMVLSVHIQLYANVDTDLETSNADTIYKQNFQQVLEVPLPTSPRLAI